MDKGIEINNLCYPNHVYHMVKHISLSIPYITNKGFSMGKTIERSYPSEDDV